MERDSEEVRIYVCMDEDVLRCRRGRHLLQFRHEKTTR